MWLSHLELVNFRNFAKLRLDLERGVVLFRGQNGQGKTNLLESIYVLATSRSPRTSVERELLRWQTSEDADLAAVVPPFARLEGAVRRVEGEVHLQLLFETSPGDVAGSVSRSIKVNGLPVRATGLVGQLPVVYFSPADVGLAGGPPAGRRQYLNLANSQASADHLRALQRYNRVLLQRNQVLRQVRERKQRAAALEPWTEQMLDWGTLILRQRLQMLRELSPRAARIFAELTGNDAPLQVTYRSSATDSSEDLAAAFREAQERLAPREIDQAVSLVGPHRDDFVFTLDDVDLNTYGSRGQQRLAVLALKLAEADWMRSEIGDLPVILLDDVLSELDPERRKYVLRRVTQADGTAERQVWITTTDVAGFSDDVLECAQQYLIDAGHVRRA
ncbi:MAG TPA: DNA replication/repair protein RecF [Chloroflexota bacterium]|jgi:DNA replication and repair protein RecF|nr:DNA replication/repair protein RecF [Chloroflexota bacterium]